MTKQFAEIVEVGPRDGFQSLSQMVPTDLKIELIRDLHAAGLRRMEATSFVSPSALPHLADATEVLAAANALPGLDAQVLVPTARHAERALAAGARHLAFVLSVSDAHNRSNVRRSPTASADEYSQIAAMTPGDVRLRLNIATAFDCPFDGPVPEHATVALLERLLSAAPRAEVALCDTTGRVGPSRVASLFAMAFKAFEQAGGWAFHAHDTFGLGTANTLTAWNVGVRVFDAAVAGLGGCPFAPGATGNVATEDLVWMFNEMDVATDVDLTKLADVARRVTRLPGAVTGGRVRDALLARECLSASAA